jgi:hypothetical protein
MIVSIYLPASLLLILLYEVSLPHKTDPIPTENNIYRLSFEKTMDAFLFNSPS